MFISIPRLFLLSNTAGGGGGVVCNEPVVDVEGDEEGGEAGDGDHVQYSWVVDKEKQAILTFEMLIDFLKVSSTQILIQSLKM